MPETQAPPATGDAGDGTTAAATQQQAGDATQTGAAGDISKTFTQTDVDRIVQERLARAKPADYDELQAAATELARIKEGEKTDLQKATERAQKAEGERDSARVELTNSLKLSEIRIEALKQGADEELVALALVSDETIEVKDGKVTGAKEAVEKLLEKKPNLKVGGATQTHGEFGGSDQKTLAEQIADLERNPSPENIRKARDLKIQQAMSLQT